MKIIRQIGKQKFVIMAVLIAFVGLYYVTRPSNDNAEVILGDTQEINLGDNKYECSSGKYKDTFIISFCRWCHKGYYCPGDDKEYKCPNTKFTTAGEGADSSSDCYICASGPGTYRNGDSCELCPIGYYCNSGLTKEKCPDGTTTTVVGAKNYSDCIKPKATATPITCPKGQYLKNNKCYICPSGSYCVQNSKADCPKGYTSSAGATSISKCYKNAEAGYGWSAFEMSKCPAGSYSKSRQVYYGIKSVCTACPEGTYQNLTGQSSCKKCPSGKTPNSTKTACVTSVAGCYLHNGEYIWGKFDGVSGYTKINSITTASACVAKKNPTSVTCAAGYYLPGQSTKCTVCPRGYYCSGGKYKVGDSSPSGLVRCPSGKTTKSTGSSKLSQCISTSTATPTPTTKCRAGKYLSGGKCVVCPSGYTSLAGATAKSQCYITVAAGYKLISGTVSKCAAGSYSKARKVNYGKNSSCTACPKGYFQSSTGKSSCIKCVNGATTSKKGATKVSQCFVAAPKSTPTPTTKCTVGKYLSGGKCVACPSGYTSSAGATAKTQCYKNISAGYRIVSGKISKCPVGSYSNARRVNYGKNTSCIPCAKGSYQNSTGKSSCIKCPSGKTTDRSGATSVSQCKSVSMCVNIKNKAQCLSNAKCRWSEYTNICYWPNVND